MILNNYFLKIKKKKFYLLQNKLNEKESLNFFEGYIQAIAYESFIYFDYKT